MTDIVAVIGLGYVGLPLAVEFGKIRPVVGFDINAVRIAQLRAGQDLTQEVSTEEFASRRADLPNYHAGNRQPKCGNPRRKPGKILCR